MQINNLARDNLHDKLGILSELVTDEFWPWFANYMVVKRAAQVGYPHRTACASYLLFVSAAPKHGLPLVTRFSNPFT